jgi:endoglucanase
VCGAQLSVTKQWEGGYQGEVIVTAWAPLADWQVALNLEGATVSASWDSTLAVGATGLATAANLTYNGTLAASSTATFGFTADGTSPSDLAAVCTGEATGPIAIQPSAAPTGPPTHTSPSNVNSPGDDDWLHTDGNRIVDAQGRAAWLTGANWYGFNLEQRMLVGLNVANHDELMDQVASRGINVIRVPISTELLLEWRDGEARVPQSANASLNPDLAGKTTLEVFDAFLQDAKDRGVKVFLDVHSALADDDGHLYPVWFNDPITTHDFIDAWSWVAERYADDDTLIGFDLKNEPHGQPSESPRAIWDASKAATNWRRAAEQAGDAILAKNPHALIFVEGIEASPRAGTSFASTDNGAYNFSWWGGDLRFAGEFPVTLSRPSQLVYSPHDYGPLVYDQPWFQKPFTAETLKADVWEPNWLYLHDDGTAPLLIGEWGGRLGQDPRQDKWMVALRDLIVEEHLSFTFWCLNPESGDTGGLFANGWGSWDEEKYAMLRPALWQTPDGKFVSLDHVTPLPGGVSLTEYYAAGYPAPE